MKSSLKRVITALLAAVMLAAIPCMPAFGAQEYYVNDGENTLALADAYAIGADGSTAKLPERGVYAATASGTQLLGGSEYDDEQPNIPNGIVRVGLAFGSTALDAVHLQIKTGSGFAFGYYDSDRVFQSVGSTAESAVTVIADTNVTVGTARSALIMSSSAIPMRALTLRRQRPTAAAAIRCIITAATACASAVTGARTMHRRGRGQLSPAAHAVCWS